MLSAHKWIVTFILLRAFPDLYANREDNIINGMNPSPTSTIMRMSNLVLSIPPSLPTLPVYQMDYYEANPKHHVILSVNSDKIFISSYKEKYPLNIHSVRLYAMLW